jgi:hypothetical protein
MTGPTCCQRLTLLLLKSDLKVAITAYEDFESGFKGPGLQRHLGSLRVVIVAVWRHGVCQDPGDMSA